MSFHVILWGDALHLENVENNMLLLEWFKQLSDGNYIMGNTADLAGGKILVPFTGRGHRSDPAKDAYNFYKLAANSLVLLRCQFSLHDT